MGPIPEMKPYPDPSVMTTTQLDRAIAALKNEITTRFEAVDTRLNAMDRATALAHDDFVRVPTEIQKAISGLRELLEQKIETAKAKIDGNLAGHAGEVKEKLAAVELRFNERDQRFDLRAGDARDAVNAAFAAANEARGKIESGFSKQIDQLGAVINATNAGLNDKIDDMRSRIQVLETQTKTVGQGQERSIGLIGTVIAGVVGFVVVMGGIFAVVGFVVARVH